MLTVYKYPIVFPAPHKPQIVEFLMPAGASITRMDYQDGVLCAWALIDRNAPEEIWTFTKALTGSAVHPATVKLWTVTPNNFATMYHISQLRTRPI